MEELSTAIAQQIQTTPPDGWFFYTLTIFLFLAVCGIVYSVFKWFLNRLDAGEKRRDEDMRLIADAITEIKMMLSVHENEIENLKRRRK